MRIEAIAGILGARVFRAETGEANVVNCAEELRAQGWIVRILGEGSNGGTIIYPSRVRDPLSTLGSLIRLLRYVDDKTGESCFSCWLAAKGSTMHPQPGYGLDEVIATLPSWITTSAFEPYAALHIRSSNTAALMRAYRNLFLAEWPRLLPALNQRFGITSWKAFVSIGPHEFEIDDDCHFKDKRTSWWWAAHCTHHC